MTDTNRMTDQDRKNGSYNRPPSRFEQERQRGYDQNDYYPSRDDNREEYFEDRGRGRQRPLDRSDRFVPGSTFEDHEELMRRGIGHGRPSGQFGAGRSSREDATDPEYWRDRADRYERFSSQEGQGDWNERLWRSANGQQDGGNNDRGQHRFSRGHPAPDWRESQFGKGPKGYKRSDERIAEEINQCLTDDHRIDARDIEVKVEHGEVSLTGTVADRRCRREVEDLVESISGVSDVSNQLKVRRSDETAIERGLSRSTTNPATRSSSSSKSGGSGVA